MPIYALVNKGKLYQHAVLGNQVKPAGAPRVLQAKLQGSASRFGDQGLAMRAKLLDNRSRSCSIM